MPSRFFYRRTADGFLEKKKQQEELIDPTLSRYTTSQLPEDGFKMEFEEFDPWMPGWNTSEELSPQLGCSTPETVDIIYENMLLGDAPVDQDNIWSNPVRDGPFSSCNDSELGDASHDQDERSKLSHPLSPSEIRRLRDIAMPQLNSPNTCEAGELKSRNISESDVEVQSKKRKSSKSSVAAEPKVSRQTKKQQGHNAIEKRYRSSLNDKIYALRLRVPSLRVVTEGLQTEVKAEEDGELSPSAGQKYGKAEVLTGAVSYISHLEGTVDRLGGDVALLKARITAFERLALSGSIVLSGHGNPKSCATETLQTVQADFNLTNQGMITTSKSN